MVDHTEHIHCKETFRGHRDRVELRPAFSKKFIKIYSDILICNNYPHSTTKTPSNLVLLHSLPPKFNHIMKGDDAVSVFFTVVFEMSATVLSLSSY